MMDAIDRLVLDGFQRILIEGCDVQTVYTLTVKSTGPISDQVREQVIRFTSLGATEACYGNSETTIKLDFARSALRPSECAIALTEVLESLGYSVNCITIPAEGKVRKH